MIRQTITRKQFIEQTAALAVVGISAGTLTGILAGCTNVRYVTAMETKNAGGNAISVALTEFAETVFVVIRKGGSVSTPIYVCKHTDGTFSALVMKCTHKGCEVRPAGDLLICPCHGSEFNNRGKVLSPPALEDLQQFRTGIAENVLIIYLQEAGVR